MTDINEFRQHEQGKISNIRKAIKKFFGQNFFSISGQRGTSLRAIFGISIFLLSFALAKGISLTNASSASALDNMGAFGWILKYWYAAIPIGIIFSALLAPLSQLISAFFNNHFELEEKKEDVKDIAKMEGKKRIDPTIALPLAPGANSMCRLVLWLTAGGNSVDRNAYEPIGEGDAVVRGEELGDEEEGMAETSLGELEELIPVDQSAKAEPSENTGFITRFGKKITLPLEWLGSITIVFRRNIISRSMSKFFAVLSAEGMLYLIMYLNDKVKFNDFYLTAWFWPATITMGAATFVGVINYTAILDYVSKRSLKAPKKLPLLKGDKEFPIIRQLEPVVYYGFFAIITALSPLIAPKHFTIAGEIGIPISAFLSLGGLLFLTGVARKLLMIRHGCGPTTKARNGEQRLTWLGWLHSHKWTRRAMLLPPTEKLPEQRRRASASCCCCSVTGILRSMFDITHSERFWQFALCSKEIVTKLILFALMLSASYKLGELEAALAINNDITPTTEEEWNAYFLLYEVITMLWVSQIFYWLDVTSERKLGLSYPKTAWAILKKDAKALAHPNAGRIEPCGELAGADDEAEDVVRVDGGEDGAGADENAGGPEAYEMDHIEILGFENISYEAVEPK